MWSDAARKAAAAARKAKRPGGADLSKRRAARIKRSGAAKVHARESFGTKNSQNVRFAASKGNYGRADIAASQAKRAQKVQSHASKSTTSKPGRPSSPGQGVAKPTGQHALSTQHGGYGNPHIARNQLLFNKQYHPAAQAAYSNQARRSSASHGGMRKNIVGGHIKSGPSSSLKGVSKATSNKTRKKLYGSDKRQKPTAADFRAKGNKLGYESPVTRRSVRARRPTSHFATPSNPARKQAAKAKRKGK